MHNQGVWGRGVHGLVMMDHKNLMSDIRYPTRSLYTILGHTAQGHLLHSAACTSGVCYMHGACLVRVLWR